jgi:hypothetical protein
LTGITQTGQATVAVGLAELKTEVSLLRAALLDISVSRITLEFSPGRSRLFPQGYDAAGQRQQQQTPLPPPDTRQPAVDLGGPLPLQPTAIERQQQADSRRAPEYKLSRRVSTVPDLWREWTVGLAGLPSINALNAEWGSSWRRNSQPEKQYYSMRKVLIDEIIARAGGTDDTAAIGAAVAAMEDERVRGGASLDKLIKAIKAERKGRD